MMRRKVFALLLVSPMLCSAFFPELFAQQAVPLRRATPTPVPRKSGASPAQRPPAPRPAATAAPHRSPVRSPARTPAPPAPHPVADPYGGEDPVAPAGGGELNTSESSRSSPASQESQRSGQTSGSSSHGATFALGLNLGWEAPYGNSLSVHYFIFDALNVGAGVGYNFTGPKMGVGIAFEPALTESFGLALLASFGLSLGRSGEISFDAKFTPEGSSASEDITATRKYTLSNATMAYLGAGLTINVWNPFRVLVMAGYNLVLSGNKVTFDDDIKYSKNIEATNGSEFDGRFRDEAEKLVKTGGPGGFLSLQYLF